MEHVCRIEHAAEIPAVLALDERWTCGNCSSSVREVARAVLRDFCEWWLSEAQRAAWGVWTVIDGMRGEEDYRSADAIFKFKVGDKVVSAFLILCQHAEDKKYPHYQLQAPHGNLAQIIEAWPLRAEAEKAVDECDRRVEAFRVRGARSVALEPGLSEADRRAIRDVIALLVKGLCAACPRGPTS